MSAAARVPETWELTGDDARETLAHRSLATAPRRVRAPARRRRVQPRAVARVRDVARARAGHRSPSSESPAPSATRRRQRSSRPSATFPGPAGKVLTDAVVPGAYARTLGQYIGGHRLRARRRAHHRHDAHRTDGAGLNRLYGIEQDRPTVEKYGRALVLALTVGLLASAAFVAVAFGHGHRRRARRRQRAPSLARRALADRARRSGVRDGAPLRRSPRAAPARVVVARVRRVGVGAALGARHLRARSLLQASTSFGETYGPLAGIVALLLWALLSSIAILYGAAVAAQLEAVRSRGSWPRDERRRGSPTGERRPRWSPAPDGPPATQWARRVVPHRGGARQPGDRDRPTAGAPPGRRATGAVLRRRRRLLRAGSTRCCATTKRATGCTSPTGRATPTRCSPGRHDDRRRARRRGEARRARARAALALAPAAIELLRGGELQLVAAGQRGGR